MKGRPGNSPLERRGGGATIAARLVWLVIACVLPGALIAAIFAVDHYLQEKARLGHEALATARALAASVDRELVGLQSGLFALATSPYLGSNNLRAFHAQASDALRTMNASNIVLVDAQGRQLINTLRPFGDSVAGTAPEQVLRIFKTGQPAVTHLFRGTVLQRPLVGINVPVRRDDTVLYALGAAMLPDRLSRLLAEQRLPTESIAAIIDSEGNFVARSQGIDRYVGQRAPPALTAAMNEAREGILAADTIEGVPVYGAFTPSNVSGWTIAVGIPREQLSGALRGSLLTLAAAATVLLAGGLALAWAIARGIAGPVRALTIPARELALGRPVNASTLGLREADEVGSVLAETSARLRTEAEARERAEREVRESGEQLRRIFDNMFVFVGLLSLDGRVLEVNRAPLEAAGLTREQVIGQPCAEMAWFSHSAEAQARLRGALARAAAGEVVRYDETIAVRGGQRMVIDLMFSPLRDATERIHLIVGSATDITERTRAADRLRELARRLMETEETERRSLNRELHDRVGANLSAVNLGLSTVRSQLAQGAHAPAARRLDELGTLLAQTIRHARDLMGELSPPGLADYGLPAALNAYAESTSTRSGLQLTVHAGAELEPRPPLAVETAFFRIAQEALSNVLKHAGVRRADIRLSGAADAIAMTISDAGRGFSSSGTSPQGTWGMRTMRERAEAIGASFVIEAVPGAGTRVTVEWRRGVA